MGQMGDAGPLRGFPPNGQKYPNFESPFLEIRPVDFPHNLYLVGSSREGCLVQILSKSIERKSRESPPRFWGFGALGAKPHPRLEN